LEQQKTMNMGQSLEDFDKPQQLDQEEAQENAPYPDEEEQEAEEEIDWKKVGRVYREDEQIESVIDREMERLKKALDKKMQVQDVDLEEKFITSKGKKK